MRPTQNSLFVLLSALVVMSVASAVGVLLNVEFATPVAYLTFFPAIFACSYLGGRRGGYLGLVFSAPGVAWFLPPAGFAIHHTPGAWLSVAIFVVTAVVIVRVTGRLQEAILWRDTLVSIVSHDLRSPLSAIELQAGAIRRGAQKGALPAEVAVGYADAIKRQVGRLVFMIDNLLDMSRVRAGKLELRPVELDLAEVGKGLVGRFASELEYAHISITLTGADKPVPGRWDRMAIEQIGSNLVSNAVKYGDKKPIEIAVGSVNGTAFIEVRDHGPGMTPDERRRVFEAFERGQTTGGKSGHGLGLWIVGQYVKVLKGRVLVEARPDGGTRFRVEFPQGRSR